MKRIHFQGWSFGAWVEPCRLLVQPQPQVWRSIHCEKEVRWPFLDFQGSLAYFCIIFAGQWHSPPIAWEGGRVTQGIKSSTIVFLRISSYPVLLADLIWSQRYSRLGVPVAKRGARHTCCSGSCQQWAGVTGLKSTWFWFTKNRLCTVWAIAALWGLESTVGAGILAGHLLIMEGRVCIYPYLIDVNFCNLCIQEGHIPDLTSLSRTLSPWCWTWRQAVWPSRLTTPTWGQLSRGWRDLCILSSPLSGGTRRCRLYTGGSYLASLKNFLKVKVSWADFEEQGWFGAWAALFAAAGERRNQPGSWWVS